MMLADGVVGQMMEKVVLPPYRPRRTAEQIAEQCPWAVTGKPASRRPNVLTTLELDPMLMEKHNEALQAKYSLITENEVRYQEYFTDDCEYLIMAFGSVARICLKAIEELRKEGVKVGLLRPITLWPFPSDAVERLASKVKGIIVAELNAGQMIEDVMLAAKNVTPVYHFGRTGGIVPDPQEVIDSFYNYFTPES